MKAIAILVVTACAILGPLDRAWAADQKQVLVLYSTRRDAQVSVVGDRELPRILEQGLPAGLDYYSEYLDLARSPDPHYQSGFRDFLRVKYRGVQFDLVIAVMDAALEFAQSNRAELFPQAPIVFVSTNPTPPPVSNGTGISAALLLDRSIDLAAALQPDLRHVFVVTGVGTTDKSYERIARAQFRRLESRFAVTYLAGLPMRELEARLATMPDHSIAFFAMVYQDGAGENFNPLDALDRVVRVANAPVYCWVDSALDHGVLGGSLKDQLLQTQAIGKLALQVLSGVPADSIPVSSPPLYVNQVDWRQLRRWGISESRLPAGTVVRFREPSIWDRYQAYILGAIAIFLAQTALITGLLVQRTRRRQAERRIRDLGSRLLNAQESERARIARDLHDDISQQMALLEIDLTMLRGAVQDDAMEMVGEALSRSQDIARSVHDLSHRLHPAKLRLIGLVSALQGLQREMSQSGAVITFTHDDITPALAPELTLCVFRIVQEALQNANKHGGATRIAVRLSHGAKGLTLSIVDDGSGFDVSACWGKGLGLISMKERLEAVGGRMEIRSKPGAGTSVEVIVPILHSAEGLPSGIFASAGIE